MAGPCEDRRQVRVRPGCSSPLTHYSDKHGVNSHTRGLRPGISENHGDSTARYLFLSQMGSRAPLYEVDALSA